MYPIVRSWPVAELTVYAERVLSALPATYAKRETWGVWLPTTTSRVEALTTPKAATICGLPIATPVASPEASTVADAVSEDDHVTDALMSLLPPSLNVPIAPNCCLPPAWMAGFAGESAIETKFAGGGGGDEELLQEASPKIPITHALKQDRRLRRVWIL
jgi:hypothetical protein